jgi:hypothetical protein
MARKRREIREEIREKFDFLTGGVSAGAPVFLALGL